jgi:hypothetical protein
LPGKLWQRCADGLAEDWAIGHELQVLGVGKLVKVLRTAQDGDTDRRVREDAREA